MMISVEDMISISRAVELLHNGVDITQLDTLKCYYNPKTKKVQNRISEHIPSKFIIKYDTECTEFLDWMIGDHMIRSDASYKCCFDKGLLADETTVNVTVDLKTLKDVMTALRHKNFAFFSGFHPSLYDEDYNNWLEEQKKSFDDTSLEDAKPMIDNLSNSKIRQNLEVLLTFSGYEEELGNKILSAFDTPETDFEIKGFEKYKIVDRRMYIKIPPYVKNDIELTVPNAGGRLNDLNYLVISRNPYDYYFCSWGSSIQSCFSLNSTCRGWHGIVPMSTSKGHFLVYATTGIPNKANIINGTKWYCPRILFRFWGWLSDKNQLLMDKWYIGTEYSNNSRLCDKLRDYVASLFGYDYSEVAKPCTKYLKYATELGEINSTYNCHWYMDSTKFRDNGDVVFKGISYGSRSFVGNDGFNGNYDLYNAAQQVTKVPETYKYTTSFKVVDGILSVLKLCPITKLPITDSELQSKYAKFFTKPVNSLLVLTFLDGCFKIDTFSSKSSNSYINVRDITDTSESSYKDGNCLYLTPTMSSPKKKFNIKTFKEMITGHAKMSNYDCILVRYIEDDKVTFVKYKGK